MSSQSGEPPALIVTVATPGLGCVTVTPEPTKLNVPTSVPSAVPSSFTVTPVEATELTLTRSSRFAVAALGIVIQTAFLTLGAQAVGSAQVLKPGDVEKTSALELRGRLMPVAPSTFSSRPLASVLNDTGP